MPKIAHAESDSDLDDSVDRRTSAMTVTATRGADAARGAVRQSLKDSTELGQLFVKLLNEQMRHNLGVATAFGRTVAWHELVQVQGDFVRASFERMSQLNSRYLEFVQAGMRSATSAIRT